MKNKSNLSRTILLSLLIILIFSSCKKDEDNKYRAGNKDKPNQFSVTIDYGDNYDYYWVVLHNLNGTEVFDYKKLEGNGTASFAGVNENLITVTIAKIKTDNKKTSNTYISISSFIAAPFGIWKFGSTNSGNGELLGTADISMTYDNSSYDSYTFSTSSSSYYTRSQIVPLNIINIQKSIFRLNEGNKISFYAALFDENGGNCNWQLNQDFQLNETNYYSFEINKTLNSKTVSTNKPFSNVFLSGYSNGRKTQLPLFYFSDENGNPNTENDLLYPFDIPVNELRFSGNNGYEAEFNYYYSKYYDALEGLPNNIEIPTTTISAIYDEINNEFSNISLNGTADMISGEWSFYHSDENGRMRVSWYVHGNYNVNKIRKPTLPQEILDEIGGEISLLEANSIYFSDYNTTSNFVDVVNRFTIIDVPFNQNYDEYYRGSYLFNNNKYLSCFSTDSTKQAFWDYDEWQ